MLTPGRSYSQPAGINSCNDKIAVAYAYAAKAQLALNSSFSADLSQMMISFHLDTPSTTSSCNITCLKPAETKLHCIARKRLCKDILLTANIDRHNTGNYSEVRKRVKQHLIKVKRIRQLDGKLFSTSKNTWKKEMIVHQPKQK